MRFYDEIASVDAALRGIKPRSFNENFREDINIKDVSGGIPCRFCGQQMHECKTTGNFHFWTCDTLGCMGNQDTKRVFDNNARYVDEISNIGNTRRIWSPFRPI